VEIDKSIIILTSFFDANYLIGNGYMLHDSPNNDSVYKMNFINESSNGQSNYIVNSIALSIPPMEKLKNIRSIERVDCLCPTYNMLNEYRKDKDWSKYTERYMRILGERKSRLKSWIDSLIPNKIYFLCCWENTSCGSKCHREIYYDILKKSKKAREKIFPIYRDGSCSLRPEKISVNTYEENNNVINLLDNYNNNANIIMNYDASMPF